MVGEVWMCGVAWKDWLWLGHLDLVNCRTEKVHEHMPDHLQLNVST